MVQVYDPGNHRPHCPLLGILPDSLLGVFCGPGEVKTQHFPQSPHGGGVNGLITDKPWERPAGPSGGQVTLKETSPLFFPSDLEVDPKEQLPAHPSCDYLSLNQEGEQLYMPG